MTTSARNQCFFSSKEVIKETKRKKKCIDGHTVLQIQMPLVYSVFRFTQKTSEKAPIVSAEEQVGFVQKEEKLESKTAALIMMAKRRVHRSRSDAVLPAQAGRIMT